MKLLARQKSDQNTAAVDPWTLVHFSSGLALGLMNARPGPVLLAAAAYEIAEQFIERSDAGHKLFSMKGPESHINVLVDLAVLYVGYRAGKRWIGGP